MNIDKEKIKETLEQGADMARKVAAETKQTVVTKYNEVKLKGQLDDLYLELGMLVNRAYNNPGTVEESEVADINEKINAKREELSEVSK